MGRVERALSIALIKFGFGRHGSPLDFMALGSALNCDGLYIFRVVFSTYSTYGSFRFDKCWVRLVGGGFGGGRTENALGRHNSVSLGWLR